MTKARLRQLKDLKAGQRWFLLVLSSFANDNGECWPSQRELAEITGFSLRTVNSYIKELCEKNYIESKQRINRHGDLDTCLYTMKVDISLIDMLKAKKNKVVAIRPREKDRLTDRSWDDIRVEI